MRRPLTLIVEMAFVVCTLAVPGAPRAVDSREAEAASSPRALNGHVFLPSPFVVSPFSTTHLSNITAYGYASATGPELDLEGRTTGELDLSLAAFGNNVQYQYRFADWLSARASGNVTIFSGVDTKSVLTAGASFRYNAGLGVTSGFRLGDTARLALVVDANFQPAFDLTIAEGILRAIATGSFESAEVFVLGRTIEVRPGVSVAWAPHRLVGIQAEVRYVYIDVEDSSVEDTSGDAVDMAVLVDFDLASIWKPIGLTLLYRQQEPTGDEGFRIQNAGVGVFYTGRPHLAAGLTVTGQWFNVRPVIEADALLAHLIVRYYW